MSKFTEDHKQKLSEALKERWTDPEYREDICQKFKAAWTPERREAMAERQRNRLKSEAELEKLRKPKKQITKDRMREAKLGVKKSPEHVEAMRKAQYLRDKVANAICEEHECTKKEAYAILKADKEHYYAKYS